jgi:NAD(P)-dependent dehydrogenase (short-subunit alcohol dehydrogenase family)
MNVNVRGVFLCSKYAIPLMDHVGGGSIVNTGSYTANVALEIVRRADAVRGWDGEQKN